MLKVFTKGVGFFGHAFFFILTAFTGRLFLREPRRREFSIHMASSVHASALQGLGVHIHVIQKPSPHHSNKPYFVVANHVSDLDPILLNAITPLVFITSQEVRETPFLGTCAILAGSVFVERRKKFQLQDELISIRRVLDDGFDVAVFPEGTSSNGESVLPFKNALFQAAIDAEAILLPVVLNYRLLNGKKPTPATRDAVFYYGKMTFLGHLKKLLAIDTIEVECRFLPTVPLVKTDSRVEICQQARISILEHYTPVL